MKSDTLTKNDIVSLVRELDPTLHANALPFKAMVVLLALGQVEHTEDAICEFTGYFKKRVKKFLENLTRNGVIKDGVIDCSWDDTEEGIVSFHLDAMVAMGVVKRVQDTPA